MIAFDATMPTIKTSCNNSSQVLERLKANQRRDYMKGTVSGSVQVPLFNFSSILLEFDIELFLKVKIVPYISWIKHLQATDRLMKELRDIYRSPNFKSGAYQVTT